MFMAAQEAWDGLVSSQGGLAGLLPLLRSQSPKGTMTCGILPRQPSQLLEGCQACSNGACASGSGPGCVLGSPGYCLVMAMDREASVHS